MSDGSSTLTQLPSEQTIWMFSYCVSSCSCEPTCFSHCAPPRDGQTERKVMIGQQRGSEWRRLGPMCVLFMFKLQRPGRRRKHELSEHTDCHSTSKGDPYFIYEYAAWSFLIFNKEIWFTNLFLICGSNSIFVLLVVSCALLSNSAKKAAVPYCLVEALKLT